MARSLGRKPKLIANTLLCDIDWSVTSDLAFMDVDESWEKLAQCAGYTFRDILMLKCESKGSSATTMLLWKLGCDGHTVKDLYENLQRIRRMREMDVLEDYVRRKNEPPLSSYFTASNQATNKEPPEEKPSCGSQALGDLDSFLNRVPIPDFGASGAASKPPSWDSGVSGGGGSAINYNQPSPYATHRKNQPGTSSKSYPEKSIPGRELVGEGFSCMLPSYPPQAKKLLPTESVENSDSNTDVNSTTGTSNSSRTDNVSPVLPSSIGPSVSQVDSSSTGITMLKQEPAPKALFNFKDLSEATQNFSDENLIGQGAFGKVYKGTLRHLDCAIKRLNVTEGDMESNMNQVISELSHLRGFPHENIIVLYGFALDGPQPCMVYQLMANGSLHDRLMMKNQTRPLTWERRLNILVGASKGLQHLHTFMGTPLIHSDIKSANILLDQNLEAKLADLGQARYALRASVETQGFTHVTVDQTNTAMFGTKAYHAPEVLSSGQISMKSDVYAMGVVFLEVCSGLQAYDPNRGRHSFLAGLFNEIEENQWIDDFRDRSLEGLPEGSFMDVLLLARLCIVETKSRRPKSGKLLKEIKARYNDLTQQTTVSSCGSNLLSSLEVNFNDSLPLRIQLAYDQKKQWNSSPAIDRITANFNDTCLVDQGLGQVTHQGQGQGVNTSSQHSVNVSGNEEHFKSDPRKMEQLLSFDKDNFSANQTENIESVVYQCDPNKLAYMRTFDDSFFQPPGNDSTIVNFDPSSGIQRNDEFASTNIPSSSLQVMNQSCTNGTNSPSNDVYPRMIDHSVPADFSNSTIASRPTPSVIVSSLYPASESSCGCEGSVERFHQNGQSSGQEVMDSKPVYELAGGVVENLTDHSSGSFTSQYSGRYKEKMAEKAGRKSGDWI